MGWNLNSGAYNLSLNVSSVFINTKTFLKKKSYTFTTYVAMCLLLDTLGEL